MGNQALKQANQDLCRAVQRGDLQAVEALLLQNASQGSAAVLDDVSKDGSPLQIAAKNARLDILTLLLENGADVNVRDQSQWTALHCAARSGVETHSALCVQRLLERRGDAFAATELGATPLDLARRTGCKGCVRALEGHAVLWQGWTDVEKKILLVPTWSSKWTVLLRDRRYNTGPSLFARGDFHNFIKKAHHLVQEQLATAKAPRCPRCGKANPVPDFVEHFPCQSCGAALVVPTSLQLAVYDEEEGGIAAAPSQVLPVGKELRLSMEEGGGWFRKLLPTERKHGLTITAHENGNETRLALRFGSTSEREEVRKLLQTPVLRGRGLVVAEEYAALLRSPAVEEELPAPSAPPADFIASVRAAGEERHAPEPAPAPSAAPSAPDDGLCVVCLEKNADTAMVPCGHLCVCQGCVRSVMAGERLCPVCRAEATPMQIYRS